MFDRIRLYKDTELSNKARLVYFYLCDRASRTDKSCFPSMKTIGKELNLSLTSVKRALGELTEKSYISKENRFRENGGKTSNRYYIL